MSEVLFYFATALFALTIFPIHITNYISVSGNEKLFVMDIRLYKVIKVATIANSKQNVFQFQMNGKEIEMKGKSLRTVPVKKVFNSLFIQKVVQLTDIGMQNDMALQFLFYQRMATSLLYGVMRQSGKIKLRNYTVCNDVHDNILYNAKIVTIVNNIVIGKLLLIFLWEKWNERKNKSQTKTKPIRRAEHSY